jgi:hypothetical protein
MSKLGRHFWPSAGKFMISDLGSVKATKFTIGKQYHDREVMRYSILSLCRVPTLLA